MDVFLTILKIILFALLAAVAALVIYVLIIWIASLFVDNKKPLTKQNEFVRRGITNAFKLVCWLFGAKIHVSGKELLPQDKCFQLVCNHRSGFDPLCFMSAMPDVNIAFIAKPSIMKIPIVGRVSYAAGGLAIDRENDRNALKTILTAAGYIKNGVCSIGIFPEGTRSKTLELLPFHAGSFKIAQRAGAPLVIAATHGTENIKSFFKRPKDVYIDILEVVPGEKLKEMKTQEISDYARNIICEKLS